jgi:hypothetical protein
MSNTVELKRITKLQRIMRVGLDARALAETMTGADVLPVMFIIERARDDLSRVLERGKKELEP